MGRLKFDRPKNLTLTAKLTTIHDLIIRCHVPGLVFLQHKYLSEVLALKSHPTRSFNAKTLVPRLWVLGQLILASIAARGESPKAGANVKSCSGYTEEWQSFSAYKTKWAEPTQFARLSRSKMPKQFSVVDLHHNTLLHRTAKDGTLLQQDGLLSRNGS